jgi:hypothetical protein
MLKWTTYDGTEATLPPKDAVVVLNMWTLARRVSPEMWAWPGVRSTITVGDSWLPIPTPADCEQWEALREKAQAVASRLDGDGVRTTAIKEDLLQLIQALAALAPKE